MARRDDDDVAAFAVRSGDQLRRTADSDHGADTGAGPRRGRRRAQLAVAATALAAAGAIGAVVTASRPAPESNPGPARPELRRLDLDDAVPARPDVLASTRTTWRDVGRNSLEYDRFAGITDDGLVVRSRHTNDRGVTEVGLLDPATGDTEWLPPPPGHPADISALDMSIDRLVLTAAKAGGPTLLVFDRTAMTWQRGLVYTSSSVEAHVPPRVALGRDGRVYVGNPMEGQIAPLQWWSAPVPAGGRARPEPDLLGLAVAWSDDATVSADDDGRVVVSTDGSEDVISDGRPVGCDRPADFPEAPVGLVLAGDRPVVTYLCESGPLTVVYGTGRGRPVGVPGASAITADDRHVVLTSNPSLLAPPEPTRDTGRTYVLDLGDLDLELWGRGPHEAQIDVGAGLVLWNVPGHLDDNDVYDVSWRVARLE